MSTKIIYGFVLAAILAVFAATKVGATQKEFYAGPGHSLKWRAVTVGADSMQGAAKGDYFAVPQFQGNLAPRFGNFQMASNIKYDIPSMGNQAVPASPLDFGSMAREDYCGSGGCGGCRSCGGRGCGMCSQAASCARPQIEQYAPRGCGAAQSAGPMNHPMGNPMNMNISSSVRQQSLQRPGMNQASPMMQNGLGMASPPASSIQGSVSPGQTFSSSSQIPISDMTTMDSLGDVRQTVMFDRYIMANRNKKSQGLGCPIRGDLPITPNYCKQSERWFQPAANPSLDLNPGAINVLAGVNNETSRNLAQLIYHDSGNSDTTLGGIDMASEFASPLYGYGVTSTGPGADVRVRVTGSP